MIPLPAAPEPRHVPEEVSKQPAVSLRPLLRVEVAPEERLIDPPVIESPLVEASPAPEIPPANVEVAVEEELSPLFRIVRPETLNLPAIVEEAFEKRPPEELTLKRDTLAEERELI